MGSGWDWGCVWDWDWGGARWVVTVVILGGWAHQQNLGHTTGTMDHYRPLQTTMDHYTVYGVAQGLLKGQCLL